MCGGTLEIKEGMSVCECQYCGTKQTIPSLTSEKRANLYERADHFRRNNDYDKAMSIYEQILSEDSSDAEAYWGIVLSRYGIEYVEDPVTYKRVPTVNRMNYTSVTADEDYKSAIQYADSYQKDIYEAEAKEIDRIQKRILEISNKEEPFDVFICYKETDNIGRRTPDSVLANDIYHQLTQEGFRVFFSKITLEDKIGQEYEPYIFAALNSAKVMVCLGTKPEHFRAEWVRNEWSRYLTLIKNGENKTLIPAYKDMDPYDLPEEFGVLQALDMSKLGFMQDLIRGIKKIIGAKPSGVDIDKSLKNAYVFIEDGRYSKANDLLERIIDQDPKNANAYIAKLVIEAKVKSKEELAFSDVLIFNSKNLESAMKFADRDLRRELNNIINENAYRNACRAFDKASSSSDYSNAKAIFEKIPSFKDSAEYIEKCNLNSQLLKTKNKYRIIFAAIGVLLVVAIGTTIAVMANSKKAAQKTEESTAQTTSVSETNTTTAPTTTTTTTAPPEDSENYEDSDYYGDLPIDIALSYTERAEEFDGHAYAVYNFVDEGLDDYDDIERFCESMGGHLATISSQEENDFL